MSINGKELDELFQRQYSGGFEEGRLTYTKANETEFILTMHYIHKYIEKGAKVIDIGAGCGAYTKELAGEGIFVDAVDLHEDNVSRMKELFEETGNVNVYQGNALELDEFTDESYDLVLEMGPVYHRLFVKLSTICQRLHIMNGYSILSPQRRDRI